MATIKKGFNVVIWCEDDWYIAQCLEIDVASQGETRDSALNNLREALELHFEEPVASDFPEIVSLNAEVYAP